MTVKRGGSNLLCETTWRDQEVVAAMGRKNNAANGTSVDAAVAAVKQGPGGKADDIFTLPLTLGRKATADGPPRAPT